MAAEYREHRKQRNPSGENSQQGDNATAGPLNHAQHSTRETTSSSELPPAYADVVDEQSERSLSSGKPASFDKKAALSQYDDDDSSSDDDLHSVEDDEEDWELDEVLSRSNSRGLPSYEESEHEQEHGTVDDMVRDVMAQNSKGRSLSPSHPPFVRQPLPFPVIIPQRRPRKNARGFVHAYAPLLRDCSGIDQETFISFLDNFQKSSQASPVFAVIQVSALIAGFAPSVIAMAVTTVVQIGARVGAEVQSRQRTNSFLDKMNEELFKPAGLYAMVVKYKSEAEVQQSGNSLLAHFGVSGEKVDFSTDQTIAKYSRTLSEQSTEIGGNRSMSERMQNLRLASGTTKGAMNLPDAAPLIFPDIDKAIANQGPENFKDKAKDAKDFLTDYLDRRAQMQYARDDPKSSLAVPEEQRAFQSKYADPSHPMYNGGLAGFVSGGALTEQRLKGPGRGMTPRKERRQMRHGRDERRVMRYEDRIASGRGLSRKKQRRYDRFMDEEDIHGAGRLGGRSSYGHGGLGESRGYGRDHYGGRYDGRQGRRRRGVGGPLGLVGGLISAAAGAASGSSSSSAPHGSSPAPYGRNSGSAPYGGRLAPYGGSREYEDTYDDRKGDYNYYDARTMRRSFDDRGQYDQTGDSNQYGSQPAPYDQTRDSRGSRGGGGGIVGSVRRVMREDVLYLMIVNMPSEAELAQARDALAMAKAGR